MRRRSFILSLLTSSLLGLSSGFAKTNLQIIPVKFSKRESSECLNFRGSSLLPLTKKPAAIFGNASFQVDKNQIKFQVDEKTNKSLEKAVKKYDRLALVMDGKVLHTANVKDFATNDSYRMTLRHQDKFDHLLENIAD